MKREWQGPLRWGAVLFGLYLAVHYWDSLSGLLALALRAGSPLAVGGIIAYAVNILMSQYERWYFPNSAHPAAVQSRRPVCLLLAFASLAGLVVLIVPMILPELAECVGLLLQKAAPALEWLSLRINENADLAGLFAGYSAVLTDGSVDWQAALSSLANWLAAGLGGVMGSVFALLSTTSSVLFTLVVSLIFSIYLLLGKERLAGQCTRLLRAYLPPAWYGRLMYFIKTLDGCFRRFVVGQCTEAVILGLLCMAGMLLFRFPYATMVGALIGFTALIPVAGAYIGAGVGAFMIFTLSPFQAMLFLLFIAVLQQLEGNLIYPKVVGSSIGLPGIWVLAAVTVGGGVLGIFGMLLAVPLAAACYQMLQTDLRQRSGPPPGPSEP